MRRLIATPEGAGALSPTPAFRSILVNLVTPATRGHERTVADEYTWPKLPPRLRSMPSARAMVRHWVRTGYSWAPTVPRVTP